MKLDRFLAALFSKRVLLAILIIALVLCVSACSLTLEDVFCLYFCGCPSISTCRTCMQEQGCGLAYCGDGDGSGGENPTCVAQCIDCTYGRACDCILGEITQPQCAPSQLCDRCSAGCSEEEP
ncbi:MAG: hypothetical protein IJC29_04915 [Clostridia bacterium]|nr:hypothetical protein [Clostridia bacterium]